MPRHFDFFDMGTWGWGSKFGVLYAKLVDIVQEWWYVEQRTVRKRETDPFEVRSTINKNKEAS